jgi:transposase-like protein
MEPRNHYLVRSHISEKKFREFVRYFALDVTAVQISKLSGLNRNTVNRLCRIVREKMAADCEAHAPLRGTVEVDESYFGPRRVRGRRGRGAGRKTIVFGILKRNGWVYTRIVPNAQAAVLLSIIKQKVRSGTTINSDGWTSYDGLVDMGYRKHWRVYHGKNEFARGRAHVNGIENFWGLAKVRLAKYRGMHAQTFNLHLKECEFRFNHRNDDLYRAILPLFSKKRRGN